MGGEGDRRIITSSHSPCERSMSPVVHATMKDGTASTRTIENAVETTSTTVIVNDDTAVTASTMEQKNDETSSLIHNNLKIRVIAYLLMRINTN